MKIFGKLITLLLLCGIQSFALAADNSKELQQAADRIAINEVAMRYIDALDRRDPDKYLSVFTEDAVYDVEGKLYHGHEELRGIILGLQKAREATAAAGKPVIDLYHSNLNPIVDFVSPTEAHFQAYWQTLRYSEADKAMRIGGMGRIEDVLVKQNGVWRIKHRVLTNFVPH
ncbi:MAG TPA: nuclear transport factor 2 family protein [Candidatus Acidoferrum sp.]|nr:nuclear transport factor 2 family protein [Candidatus Acidoferrum sp.]